MFLKLLLLYCFISQNTCAYVSTVVTVDSPAGQIRGLSMEHYEMFLSIPYGVVDEKNPFGNAKPHPYFDTPRNATFDADPVCPQYVDGIIKGKIQCLFLNVYRPKEAAPGRTLPVMVFIHGGAFAEGNGKYVTFLPTYLIPHEVIFVAINYRLGPYGHLCLPNSEYSNQAFKDQNLAFNWVRNNIASFGGDTNNIVLFGHSSGSISLHYHLLFNKALFVNKVILQSGVAVTPLVHQVTDTATFVKDVGLDDENIDRERFIQTISTIDTDTIINITKFYDFRPCVDGEFITSEIPNVRNLQNLTLMIGVTVKEMLYVYPSKNDKVDLVAQLDKGFSFSKMADRTDAIDEIKHFYLDSKKGNMVDAVSDLDFNYPMKRTADYYVRNKCTVYRYLFSYDGGRNFMKLRDNITIVGSTHGDELGYLFDMQRYDTMLKEKATPADDLIIDRTTLLWTNFAKYGDPTPTTSNLLPVKWTSATAGAEPYLQIDTTIELLNGPFEERMSFWDAFYAKYGKFAKGFSLGEEYFANKACDVHLSNLLVLISVWLLLVQQ